MYVMYRPSGGRGEYEIAERHGAYGPRDVLDREILVDLGPFGVKPTKVSLQLKDGKPRLRLLDKRAMHLPRQMESGLMLPKPVRTEAALPGGQPVIMEDRYILRRMQIGDLRLSDDRMVLQFTTLELANQSQSAETIDVPARLARLHELGHLTCSPKLDPVGVRVSTARWTGKEAHHEATQEAFAGPDHRQAA